MSNLMNKAAVVQAPFEDTPDGTTADHDFNVKKYTGGTLADTQVHVATAVPATWCGKFVKISAIGGDITYGFSTNALAEVDRSVAASEAGASTKVGGLILSGQSVHVLVPKNEKKTIYFVRESSTTGVVALMELASF